MLNEVKLRNTQLEEIDPSSIPDIEAYQREKFKNPRGRFTSKIMELKSNEYNKAYKLKGGEDLIQITSLLNKGIIENWDKSVGGYIETFVPKGDDSYTEYINLKESKAVIFFTKNYKSGNANYILYQNTRQNVTFFITYISNSPDSVKINNMHNIIKEMRFE